jgi:Protein of unknown function (DUF1559)
VQSPVQPSATELPKNLPLPLSDPLVGMRAPIMIVIVAGAVIASFRAPDLTTLVVMWIGAIVYLLLVGLLLPARDPDVFYLRSFRRDRDTPRVRKLLQRALGRDVRVTGIRDPRRRAYRLLRYLNYFPFILKYSTTRYLNLEAEDDWKARLWRSLCHARGAVVDVTDLTSYVVEEVWLCHRTLGPDRVLYVADASKPVSEWQAQIAGILGLASDTPVRVAVWGRDWRVRAAFAEAVASFGRELPKEPRGVHPAGSELIPPVAPATGLELAGYFWGVLAGAAFWVFLSWLVARGIAVGGTQVATAYLVVMSCFWLVLVFQLLRFVFDAAFARERWVVGGMAFIILMMPVLVLAADFVKFAAAKMMVSNNLKWIGIAHHSHNDVNGRLPAATGFDSPWGKQKHPVSWRVLLLPYVEQDQLYRYYKFDEPWDSPHNSKLLQFTPHVYRHPVAGATVPTGYTHYRVVVSPKNAHGPRAPFLSGEPGPRFELFEKKGSGRVALVVEAAEAVPWTKPDELEYTPGGPLPKLGGHFRHWFKNDVFLVAHADGSVAQYRQDLSDERARDLISIDP